MISEIDRFSSKNGELNKEDKLTLLHNGTSTGNKINGCAIEKQFETDDHYLIITSYGWAFEEGNYASLLDKDFNLISEKHIFHLYRDLSVKDAVPIKDNEVQIIFTNDASVVIQICNIPFLPLKPFLRLKRWKNS